MIQKEMKSEIQYICRAICFFLLMTLLGVVVKAQHVNPYFKCSTKLNNAYGMCSHFTFFGERGDNATFKEQSKMLHELGCNYVRFDFTGSTINEANTGTLDNIKPVLNGNKLDFLGIVFDSKLNSKTWDPDNHDFEKQLAIIKRNYINSCNYLEFHNEVNYSKLPHLAEHYVDDLKEIYALKRSKQKLKILFSGIGDSHFEFLDSAMQLGAYKYFDIMNFHTYTAPKNIPSIMNIIHQNMDKYHWNKPVWLTECGMNTAKYDLANTNHDFFTNVVPQALKKIGLKTKGLKVGVINDIAKDYCSLNEKEISEYITKRGSICEYFTLNQIKELSPKDVPVLVLTNSEYFYSEYFPSVLSYVKNGGTIILPYGAPFYYDLSANNKGVGKTYANQLHIGQLYWWDNDAKRLSAPKDPTYYYANNKLGTSYTWGKVGDGNTPRYLTNSLLKGKDRMTPISYAGNDKFKGVVAALYQLNSDLKGNIIIQTRMGIHRLVDMEDEQAKRVARIHLVAYAYGVDKVFWYEFRSPEVDSYYSEDNFGMVHKDLSPKPAYYAYKTLIKMLPNGSTRPSLQTGNGVYKVQWCRPDGQVVTAYWCKTGFTYVPVGLGKTIYDYMGNRVKATKVIKVSSGVTYVIE